MGSCVLNPLRQTSLVGPDACVGELGNCWATCIAMVVDADSAEEVPNFVASHGPPKMEWWSNARRWLRETHGLDIANFEKLDDEDWPDPPRYVIAIGPSPRGDFDHAIVWDRQGSPHFYDPHPSDDLLAGEPASFDVIVTPYDPDPEAEAAEMFEREKAHA